MAEKQGLLSSGWDMVSHNKRYIVWFYLLNLVLAMFGTAAFSNQAHEMLDHSLLSGRLVRGFDLGVLAEMFSQPKFPSTKVLAAPSTDFALLFFAAAALFLPGVLQGYASTYRLPREDFFLACGRNLWRFIRLLVVAGVVMGAVAGALFGIRAGLLKSAEGNTNELLPFYLSVASLTIIFLVMTMLRIWFDLAQTDVVLSDQRAVRRSIGTAFRHTFANLGGLLGSYVVTTLAAAIILLAGIWIWSNFVPSESVAGAFVVSQITLFALLIPRFWQRGIVVSYYMRNMVQPIPVQSFSPVTAVVANDPAPSLVAPVGSPEAEVS